VYVFDFDSLTVAHLGDLDHVPPQSLIDQLGHVNVALVPVGGARQPQLRAGGGGRQPAGAGDRDPDAFPDGRT